MCLPLNLVSCSGGILDILYYIEVVLDFQFVSEFMSSASRKISSKEIKCVDCQSSNQCRMTTQILENVKGVCNEELKLVVLRSSSLGLLVVSVSLSLTVTS